MAKTKGETHERTERRKLFVPVDDAELVKTSRDLAEALKERDTLEARKAEFTERIKADIKEAQERIDSCDELIAYGRKTDVEVRVVVDLGAGTVTTTRQDTGAVIDERPVTETDRQMYLE